MSQRHHLRNALIVANLAMLAVPTFASAGDEGALAAGLALGCCAGMAATAAMNDAHDADHERRHHRGRDRVVEVHHYASPAPAPAPPPAPPRAIDRHEARAELAEAELWAQRHCEPMVEQPGDVRVYVTFRGDDGRATETRFTPNLRGEAFEECMAAAFLRSRVGSFDKKKATVRKKLGG